MHPGWEAKTWRDPLDQMAFPVLGDLFERPMPGAQLAGLARLEVLWQYGGVYLDSDVEPIRSLDSLLWSPVFVCREDGDWCNDAVIGAEPGHPFIAACMAGARMGVESGDDPGATGPKNLTTTLRLGSDYSDVTILAARAFGPIHYIDKVNLPPVGKAGEAFPESFGLHRWAASWL